MKVKQINIAKKEVLWNYAGTLFNMGSNYFQLPFLLFFLDSDRLGLWYVLMSLSAIASLITFGFTPSFSRSVAYCWSGAKTLSKEGKVKEMSSDGEIDYHLLVNVFSTCKVVYFLMAAVAVCFLITFGTAYIISIAGNIMCISIKAGWVVFLSAVFINIYYGYYSALLVGSGGIKENSQAIAIANIVRLFLLALLLWLGFDFLGACISYFIYGYLLRVVCKRFLDRRIEPERIAKEQNISISKSDVISCLETLWPNAWKDGVVSISDYVSTQAGTLICSGFMSLEQTAAYSILSQAAVAIAKVSRSIDVAHLPVIQSAYVNDDKTKLKKTQAMCVAGYIIVFMIGTLGMVFIGLPFIHLLKPGIRIDIYLFTGLAVYQFMISYRNCYSSYLSSTNRLWYWKSYILASGICLILEVVLFSQTQLGGYVIVISSILSETVYNIWHWPRLVNRELNMNIHDYWTGMKDFVQMLLGR